MVNVIVKTQNEEINTMCEKGTLISTVLENIGFHQDKPCGGKGTCKKCEVVANGKKVLSCVTCLECDTYIDYYSTEEKKIQGVADGFKNIFLKKPLIEFGIGVAVDIGTTTLASKIYEFPKCECVKTLCIANKQSKYGADVISRIEYCQNNGIENLQNSVTGQIDEITKDYQVQKLVITGNTTMLHLLTGLDPQGIAVAPFTAKSLFGDWHSNAYLPRCISSYVGADITTAILSSGMLSDKISFLVDIGTNGEMALHYNDGLICCSTAAGPAFEGAGISMGMAAVDGAINKVYIKNNQIMYDTIGNEKPIGICGSGLIDALACMLEFDIIDESGYMEDDFFIADSNVCITSKDVRQVQLAKSAIKAGIETLIIEAKINYEDIEKFYIAGGFGSYVDKENSAKIGLIPKELVGKAVVLGNGALSGAEMILQSEYSLEESVQIAKMAKTFELSESEIFMEKYIDNMMF